MTDKNKTKQGKQNTSRILAFVSFWWLLFPVVVYTVYNYNSIVDPITSTAADKLQGEDTKKKMMKVD